MQFEQVRAATEEMLLADLVANTLVQKQEIHVGRPRSGLLQRLRERGYY